MHGTYNKTLLQKKGYNYIGNIVKEHLPENFIADNLVILVLEAVISNFNIDGFIANNCNIFVIFTVILFLRRHKMSASIGF